MESLLHGWSTAKQPFHSASRPSVNGYDQVSYNFNCGRFWSNFHKYLFWFRPQSTWPIYGPVDTKNTKKSEKWEKKRPKCIDIHYANGHGDHGCSASAIAIVWTARNSAGGGHGGRHTLCIFGQKKWAAWGGFSLPFWEQFSGFSKPNPIKPLGHGQDIEKDLLCLASVI